MVLQVCRGYLSGDNAQAADLSQEIFINIWNALPGFRGESTHKTWIFRITVNTCLLHLRKEKRSTRINLDEAENIGEEPEKGPELDKLHLAISQLEKVDRLVVMMMLEGLGQEDIARVIGITANNLRVRIHRIKQRLKHLMI